MAGPIQKFHFTIVVLTPTAKGQSDQKTGRDFPKHNYKFLYHQNSFCSHPKHRCQSKVLNQ